MSSLNQTTNDTSMAIEVKIPSVGESITEVQLGNWAKREGDSVKKDETLVEIETDKVTAELPAPEAGTLVKILKKTGEQAVVGEVIAVIETTPGSGGGAATNASAAAPSATAASTPAATPAAPKPVPSGRASESAPATPAPSKPTTPTPKPAPTPSAPIPLSTTPGREEQAVPMSPMRRRIAERLVQAQANAALLTTFNEVDMTNTMALRVALKDTFLAQHGVKLGFMSFFIKAAIHALKQFPAVNAEIRGNEIIYHNYFDIGVAIGGGKGLVVPILRNAERMSFAEIEKAIESYAKRAAEGKIEIEDLRGGTFTISNGGVYGSLLSTPIVNPPQSGILGMHAIQERPVARDKQVVIRPMMYLALTYDHRLVDGREAVSFLKAIKEVIEEPARMLLEV